MRKDQLYQTRSKQTRQLLAKKQFERIRRDLNSTTVRTSSARIVVHDFYFLLRIIGVFSVKWLASTSWACGSRVDDALVCGTRVNAVTMVRKKQTSSCESSSRRSCKSTITRPYSSLRTQRARSMPTRPTGRRIYSVTWVRVSCGCCRGIWLRSTCRVYQFKRL